MMQRQPSDRYSVRSFKINLENYVENERLILLADQKASRFRARKLSAENNKRRKAFEEKCKEENINEQRFREEMLKQRKQKLQEATERFQHSHVPKSVHRKIGHWREIPNLDTALEQIRILSPVPSFQGLGVLRNLSNSSRVTDSSLCLPATSNGTLYQKHPSTAVVAYTKLMQEKSDSYLKQNQLLFQKELEETRRNLENQHICSLKNCQETDQITFSESLTSLDSLDATQESSNCLEHDAALPLSTQDSVSSSPQKSELMTTCICTPDTMRYSFCETENTNACLNNTVRQNTRMSSISQNISEIYHSLTSTIGENLDSKLEKVVTSDKRVLTVDSETSDNAAFSFNNQSNSVQTDSLKYKDSSCNDAFNMNKQYSPVQGKTEKSFTISCSERNTQTLSCNGTEEKVVLSPGNFALIPCKAWGNSDVTPRSATESSGSEETSKVVQNAQIKSPSFSNQPLATPFVLCPSETQCASGIYSSSFPTIGNALCGNISFTRSSAVANNVEDTLSLCDNNVYTPQKQKYGETTEEMVAVIKKQANNMTCFSNTDHNSIKEGHVNLKSFCDGTFKVGSADSEQHSCQKRNVKPIKSILKKDSKYHSTSSRPVVSVGVHFEKQTRACVRDSVELTRMKEIRLNIQKPEKKLRWLDETDACNDNEDDDTHICNQHQVKISTRCPSLSMNKTTSSSSSSTNSSSDEKAENPLHNISVSSSGVTSVSGKALSTSSIASTGYHFTKHAWASAKGDEKTTRKLATSKAEHVTSIKRKSKLVKRPRCDKKVQLSTTGKSKKCTVVRTRASNNCNKVVKAHGKIIVPHPPHKPVSNNKVYLGTTRAVQPQIYPLAFHSGSHKVSQINSVGEMSVNCISNCDTPDDGILFSASAVNNNSFVMTPFPPSHTLLTLEGPCKTNNLSKTVHSPIQQDFSDCLAKQNTVYAAGGLQLDYIPLDEEVDYLWHGLQQTLTQNELAFDTNITERGKQILESTRIKHRPVLEQTRQVTYTETKKSLPSGENTVYTLQNCPFSSASNPVKSERLKSAEVSESTAQFLLAEKLVETPLAEHEILVAMENLQTSKYSFLLRKARRQGISALSLEEQRLLQSLDHLNQRLHCIQKTSNH